jgi:hypothetical protein
MQNLFSRTRPAVAGLLLLALLAGCDEPESPRPLQLADLTEGELLYVGRIVTLERAKAVALVDRPLGDALLDSLASAWGDSAAVETSARVPVDPQRAAQVANLLERMLKTELDSLMHAPFPYRLALPLPDPTPKDDAQQDEEEGLIR